MWIDDCTDLLETDRFSCVNHGVIGLGKTVSKLAASIIPHRLRNTREWCPHEKRVSFQTAEIELIAFPLKAH